MAFTRLLRRCNGVNVLMNFPDQAAPALDVASQLLDELCIAGAALGAHGLLLVFWYRQRHGQVVAQVQGHGLDQHALVAFETVELARQAIQALGQGRLPLVVAVRRKE